MALALAMTATPRVLLGNSVARTARKDNGIKSSKMKRKRQIMLRDLNWIRQHVCVCVLGCELALALKTSCTTTTQSLAIHIPLARLTHLFSSRLDINFVTWCFYILYAAVMFSLLFYLVLFVVVVLVLVLFCLLDTIPARQEHTAQVLSLKCSMAFILSAL